MKILHKTLAGYKSAYSRDGPLIFHMRDGPPNVTGPPGAIRQTCGPPRNRYDLARGSSPPTTGPPMEWLVRKKTLKKSERLFNNI